MRVTEADCHEHGAHIAVFGFATVLRIAVHTFLVSILVGWYKQF